MPSASSRIASGIPNLSSSRDDDARHRHEGGIEHVDGGDHARDTAFRAGPGLHGGESGHDEQAAGNGEARHVDCNTDARVRC